MASRALFGGATARSRQSNNLVEFKAGKMTLKGKMCHADKRKGLLYVYESEDSLMHFCWKDRTTGVVEDDLLIFPDDVTFKHVPQCTTGRVYVLKFNNSSRKFIFWMQEPKTDKDEEYCNKVNKFLNTPPTPGGGGRFGSAGGAGAGLPGLASDLSSLGEGDLQSILGNMSQQQLIQLLGGMGVGGLGGGSGLGGGLRSAGSARPPSSQASNTDPSTPVRVHSSPGPRATTQPTLPENEAESATPTPQRPVTAAAAPPGRQEGQEQTTPAPASSTPPLGAIQLSDLQSILQSMNVPGASPGSTTAGASEAQPAVDLVKTLGSSEAMVPILANPDIQARLTPFLPTGEILPSSEEELRNTFASNQYHQTLRTFGEALQSGQLGPLLSQFGLSAEAVEAANSGDVAAFARAVQEAEKEPKEEKMDED